MKIGIDARLYGPEHGGIGRYAQKVIENLEKLNSQNDYVVFLASDGYEAYQPQNPRFTKVLADFRAYSLQEQLSFPFLLNKYKLDLTYFTHFNAPIFYSGRYVLTIHDLIISHFPDSRATTLPLWLYRVKLVFYNLAVRRVARKAERIIAISEFTKQDIVKLLKIRPEKIKVVYEGAEFPVVEMVTVDNLLSKFRIKNDYLLYVGSAYPHKNLEKLLEAFKMVLDGKSESQLVLVGKKNYFYDRLAGKVAELGLSESVVLTGYLSDSEIAVLYQRARLYVFPSLMEGFGLPPLEAQNYDLPVVSSSASCLPEIMGESAVYFDPENVDEMAEKIILVLDDKVLRQELVKKGRENIQKYSWGKCAGGILAEF